MANTVKLTIKVDDNGSLNVVAKEAKAAAKATDNLGTSTDKLSKKKNRFNKLEKGTAQLGANSTKSFAKQAQTIGGGLVPAYAVLAANVFALTAAFQFLKNAADVSILEQSQVDFARNTGVALQSVTSRLREASDGMLGFSQAGQAAAIGLAKGFSPNQLEDLAEGARKASTALGRDFADSFDRLVRGASKAEPELLDELGITLRLEDATRKYADAIKVNRKELTASQRSQAVLIETQTQLNDLFGAVEAKTNPFVKLAKTLEDLVKTATQAVLPIFTFIADTINKSGAAAVAVFGLLGLNIAKAAIPIDTIKTKFGEWATASSTAVTEASEAQIKYREQLKATAAAVASQRAGAAQEGAKGLMGQNKKLGGSALLGKVASGVALSPAQKGQLNKILKDAEFSYKRHTKITTGMFKGVNIELVRDFAQSFQQMEAKSMSTGKVIGTVFTKAKLQAQVFGATVKNVVAKSFGAAGRAAEKMGTAIGAAMKFAGYIGILIMIGELIQKVFNSPYTILLNVSKLMDGLLSGLIMAVNLTVKGVLGLFGLILTGMGKVGAGIANAITGSIRGVLGSIDFVINSIIGQVNGFIETLNLVSGMDMATIGFQSNMASAVEHVKEAKSAAVDLTGTFTEFNTEVSISQSLVESTAGGLKKFEEGRDAVLRSKEALEQYGETASKIKADMFGIVAGINAQNDAQKRGMAVAQGIGSVGAGGQAQRIRSDFVIPKDASDATVAAIKANQNAAMAALRESLTSAGQISAEYASLITLALSDSATDKDIQALARFETAAQGATSGAAALKEGISGISSKIATNLGSGDIEKAISNLTNLQREAKGTAGSFRTIGQDAAADKAMQDFEKSLGLANMTASEYRLQLISLSTATQLLAVDNEYAKFQTGAMVRIMKSENEARGLGLQIKAAELALKTKLTDIEEKEITRKLELLRIELLLNKAKADSDNVAAFGSAAPGLAGSFGALADTNTSVVARDKLAADSEAAAATLAKLRDSADASAEDLAAAIEKAKAASRLLLAANLSMGSKLFEGMSADFAKLGPDGEVMSALSGGMANVLDAGIAALQLFAKEGATTSNKIVAVMGVAGAAIGAIGGFLKAKSDAAIRGIDSEIEAEKKRDGKSKGSLAKIAAMEKKKEAIKKKAFETNKKLQMAEVIMATGVAIMNSIKMGLPWGAVFGAMAAAMGAAQLATIAGTSYQGGGAAPSAGGQPSKVSLGDRNSTADLAKSRGARGELAYMRGAAGTGGMDSFKPAFSGYKNRAEGGNTGFVVGEQGPELFVPEMPGRIVPNDDVAAGGVSNVSFNINTVDASGVEDLLVAQRGNIIGMIRQAANTYGQDFVEDVDTSTFTQSAGGVSRY